MDADIDFCFCGKYLERKGITKILHCPLHGLDYKSKEKKGRIGRYSGPTKRMKGAYERD